MNRNNTWNNVPCHVSINVGYDPDAHEWTDEDGTPFPYLVDCQFPRPFSGDDCGELVIHFESSGCYSPRCWNHDDESEDERITTEATFARTIFKDGKWQDDKPITLTNAALAELDEMYADEIKDAEIDSDYGEPDYDAMRESRDEFRAATARFEP